MVAGSRTPDSATTRRSSGTSVAQPDGGLGVDRERPQVAVVDADEAGVGGQRRVQLARVVRLDQRLEAEVARLAHEAGAAPPAGAARPAAARASAPAARSSGSWRGVDHELLGQHRQGGRGAGRAQVVERAAEPVRLDEHRDGRGAARLVGPGTRGDVELRRGERAGRRRAALDLRDEVQAGPQRGGPTTSRGAGRAARASCGTPSCRRARAATSARRRAAISSSTERASHDGAPRAGAVAGGHRRVDRSTVAVTRLPPWPTTGVRSRSQAIEGLAAPEAIGRRARARRPRAGRRRVPRRPAPRPR